MMKRNNNLLFLKKEYTKELSQYYDERESDQLLTILIQHYFNFGRYELIMNPDYRLSESELLKLHFAVKELKKYKPVQYVIGQTEFYDMIYKLNENVLIPRPETEELVKLIIDNEKSNNVVGIDIGTGSGCIAISISKFLINSDIHATDISAEAIKMAQINSELNSQQIFFHKHDILNNNKHLVNNDGNLILFDFIVSNPPYVTEDDKLKMESNVVDYEPHNALFVSNDNPLKYYTALLNFAKKQLIAKGRIYFEINENLGQDTIKLLEKYDYSHCKIIKDLFGKDRFIYGVKGND